MSEERTERGTKADTGYDPQEVLVAADLFRNSYDDLIRVARRLRRRRRPSETLNTTALVHEAFLRLRPEGRFVDEHHFFSAVALAMRHTLVDHARKGGQYSPPEAVGDDIDDFGSFGSDRGDLPVEDALAVRQALDFVASQDPRLVKVVDCRYFVGLTQEETALALGLTERTVRRDWMKARALLRTYLRTSNTVQVAFDDD